MSVPGSTREAAPAPAEHRWLDQFARLKESEERFRVMSDYLPHIIWVHDAQGQQTYVNQTFCEFFGTTREEMRAGRWQLLMHPDQAGPYVEEFAACVREQRLFHATTRVRKANGEWAWIESWGRPRFDELGVFQGHVGTSVDVTERRAQEEQRDLMARELAHRVKNTLTVVSALAHLTFTREPAAAEALKEFRSRLGVLSACNDMLLAKQWGAIELGQLVDRSVEFAGPERFRISGPPVDLRPTAAQSFALVLHELCTNALKYGSLSVTSGHVAISWKVSADDRVTLTWQELGGPAVSGAIEMGFGMRMIKTALERELRGSVDVDFTPGGILCTIRWSWDGVEMAPSAEGHA